MGTDARLKNNVKWWAIFDQFWVLCEYQHFAAVKVSLSVNPRLLAILSFLRHEIVTLIPSNKDNVKFAISKLLSATPVNQTRELFHAETQFYHKILSCVSVISYSCFLPSNVCLSFLQLKMLIIPETFRFCRQTIEIGNIKYYSTVHNGSTDLLIYH